MAGAMKAQDVMTQNPSCVTPDSPLVEAARLMKDENVGVIPVVDATDSRTLVGILTDRDIAIRAVAEGRDTATTSVGHVMSRNVRSCRPDDSMDEVMELMGSEQIRRVPIVDERGSLVGIVSQADVVLETSDAERSDRVLEEISKPSGKHAQ